MGTLLRVGTLLQDYGTYSMATDILFLLSNVLSMDASILFTHLHAEALMGVRGTHCSKGWFSFEESCVLTVPRGG